MKTRILFLSLFVIIPGITLYSGYSGDDKPFMAGQQYNNDNQVNPRCATSKRKTNNKHHVYQECMEAGAWSIDSIYYYTGSDMDWILDSRHIVLTKDGAGNLLTGITEFYNGDPSFTSNKYFFNITYHNDSTRDEYRRSAWNSKLMDWVEDTYYKYDEDGKYTELANKYWDFNSNSFTGGDRKLYEYNDSRLLIHRTDQVYDTASSGWDSQLQYFYYYNGQGQMSSSYSQKKFAGGMGMTYWLNQRRDLFNYDEQGRVSKQFIMYWISGMWTNMYLFWNQYDGDGNMFQREVKVYNPVTTKWDPQQENFYNYTGNLLSDYKTTVWDKNSASWINKQQFFYQYDPDGNVTLYVEQNWDPISGSWKNTFRETTAFNDNGDEVSRVSEIWDDLTGTWGYSEQAMMDYDLAGNLVKRTSQSWAPEGYWENIKMTEYFIGLNIDVSGHKVPVCHNGHTIYVSRMALPAHLKHGDCLGHCLNEERGRGNSGDGMKGHLKSALVEAESLQPEFTRVYPNPFRESLTIEPGKDLTNLYKVEMYDLSGKVVRNLSVSGMEKVTIVRGDLSGGVYFIKLYGDQVLTQKVMIQ